MALIPKPPRTRRKWSWWTCPTGTPLTKAEKKSLNAKIDSIRKRYLQGKKVAAKSKFKPKVSVSLYAANKKLDRDKDGIACER